MESDHIPLKSGVIRSYRSAFFVDEDSLRRFQAILTKAGTGLSFPTMVVFHVEREDDRFYETENVGIHLKRDIS